jgi:hypothetical protein
MAPTPAATQPRADRIIPIPGVRWTRVEYPNVVSCVPTAPAMITRANISRSRAAIIRATIPEISRARRDCARIIIPSPASIRPNTVAVYFGPEFTVYMAGCEDVRKGSKEPKNRAPPPAIVQVAARSHPAFGAVSSTHSCQPAGGAGQEGSGCHPGGGTQPGGAGGQPGGGLSRIGTMTFLSGPAADAPIVGGFGAGPVGIYCLAASNTARARQTEGLKDGATTVALSNRRGPTAGQKDLRRSVTECLISPQAGHRFSTRYGSASMMSRPTHTINDHPQRLTLSGDTGEGARLVRARRAAWPR